MTVPTGPASLLDIQNEFGGGGPIGLNEYYKGGAYVSNPAPTSAYQQGAVPNTGTISIGNFLGLNKNFVFNDTIYSDRGATYSVTAAAVAAGWNGAVPLIATVTVNPGVGVFSSGYGSTDAAFFVDALPAGSTMTLYNNGYIVGRGGQGGGGGNGGDPPTGGGGGGTGGHGLVLRHPTYLINYGIIAGGGGGGGGGAGGRQYVGGKTPYYNRGSGGGGGGGAGWQGGGGGGAPGNNFGGPGAGQWGARSEFYGGGAGGANLGGLSGAGGNGGNLGQPGYAGGGYTEAGGGGGGGAGWAIASEGAGYPIWAGSFGRVLGFFNNWGATTLGNMFTSQGRTLGINTNGVSPGWNTGIWNWLWVNQNAQAAGVTGSIWWRSVWWNNRGGNVTGKLVGSTDNIMTDMYVNGVQIGLTTNMGFGAVYTSNTFNLIPGGNLIEIQINNSEGPGGMAMQMRDLADNVLIEADNWRY
jgi:hypothetical protein